MYIMEGEGELKEAGEEEVEEDDEGEGSREDLTW